jgi:carbohydrate-selective porin OprB
VPGMRDPRGYVLGLALVVLTAFVVVGCSDNSDTLSSSNTQGDAAAQTVPQNACPVEGCKVVITDAQAEGQEIRLTWSANWGPDFSKNHIHVYWDNYTADQVSNDAAARGVVQGEWVPTGDYPQYVTEGAVSTSVRGNSHTVCVTAGDRDHNVIDSSLVNCRDVSALL